MFLNLLLICLLSGCGKSIEPRFLIENDHVGPLTRTTGLDEISQLFAGDSLVRDSTDTDIGSSHSRIEVYQKGGGHLLTITPTADSLKRIGNIRVLDPRFTTKEGVGLGSTFEDIRSHYPIRKIVTSMNNVVIFIKGKDYYFTISREELPANLRYRKGLQVEEVQIPDQAKIKYLMVGW